MLDDDPFVLHEILPWANNAAINRIRKLTGIDDPATAVQAFNDGEWLLVPTQQEEPNKIQIHRINLADDCRSEKLKQNGWKIEKHDVGNGMLELDPSKLSLHFSDSQKNGKVAKGNNLRTELETDKVPVLNACVLEYLLLHPELIPEEWKADKDGNTRRIFFWGTIYGGSDGPCVRYLYWNAGSWRWSIGSWRWTWRWLNNNWSSGDPAACLAS